MKRTLLILLLLNFSSVVFGQNEIGPEGEKLIWPLLVIVVGIIVFVVFGKKDVKTKASKNIFFWKKKIEVKLTKNKIYYPDNLELSIKNIGNADVDIDRPLLVFDNFWLKRKFRLKGVGNRTLYPLYLEKGKTHLLQVDLSRFYLHDKKLKKYPKAKIFVYDVKGKRLGNKSVFLRKTLVKY